MNILKEGQLVGGQEQIQDRNLESCISTNTFSY